MLLHCMSYIWLQIKRESELKLSEKPMPTGMGFFSFGKKVFFPVVLVHSGAMVVIEKRRRSSKPKGGHPPEREVSLIDAALQGDRAKRT